MNNEKKRFYQKGWFLWLMLVFLPPVGIILLWVCHKKMNKIIKIVLTVIFAYWFFVLVKVGGGSGTDDNKIVSEEQTEEQTEGDQKGEERKTGEEVENDNTENSFDKFVKDVEHILQGDDDAITGISDVLYENKDLCIYVDLSQKDDSPLTDRALTMVFATQITDRILQKLPEYDDLWDTITVDFEDAGYARFTKDDIMGEGYTRCFDMANFELVTDKTQQNNQIEDEAVDEANKDMSTFPVDIDVNCRAITNIFVTEVMEEKYSMFAFEVKAFDLDENNDGTIEILYFPSGAGIEGTKVNLTISKKDETYEIIYALLAGGYEVMLDELPRKYVTYIF